MRRVIVLLLMLSSLSVLLHATPETGYFFTEMNEEMFAIAFFSQESDDCVFFTISSTSASENHWLSFGVGPSAANEEMKSTDAMYRCRELFSSNKLFLIYDEKASLDLDSSIGVTAFYPFAIDTYFSDKSIPKSATGKLSNDATREFIRGILEAHGVLILIERFDNDDGKYKTIKLIDIPLDPAECREALRRLEAFERIP